ncbi:MAG: hypothetical protein KAH32_04915 [Chlamydiia bacterium]|nr:hypothetical protein [Chlamydiia bacterium]
MIKRSEFYLVLAASFVGFCSTLNYGAFKVLKDTLVLSIGIEHGRLLLTSIKIWVMVPSSICAVFTINRLNAKVKLESVFYILAGFYLVLLLLFIWTHSSFDALCLHSFYSKIEIYFQGSWLNIIVLPIALIIRYWPIVLFYIGAELWHTTVYLFVFWGIVNTMFSADMAKRIFPIMNMAGNLSGILVAPLYSLSRALSGNVWDDQLSIILYISTTMIVVMCLSFRYFIKALKVIGNKNDLSSTNKKKQGNMKANISIVNSLSMVANSGYIASLVATMICYNMVMNLTEILWKGMLISVYSSDKIMIAYKLSLLVSHIAVASAIMGMLLPFVINILGVKRTAVLYPIVAMIPISIFVGKCGLLLFSGSSFVDIDLAPYIWIGHAGLVAIKSGKYVVYDSVKDICLNILPYKHMMEVKGMLETVFSRLGKSAGSLYYNLSSSAISEAFASTYATVLVGLVGTSWVFITYLLGSFYEAKVKQKTLDK